MEFISISSDEEESLLTPKKKRKRSSSDITPNKKRKVDTNSNTDQIIILEDDFLDDIRNLPEVSLTPTKDVKESDKITESVVLVSDDESAFNGVLYINDELIPTKSKKRILPKTCNEDAVQNNSDNSFSFNKDENNFNVIEDTSAIVLSDDEECTKKSAINKPEKATEDNSIIAEVVDMSEDFISNCNLEDKNINLPSTSNDNDKSNRYNETAKSIQINFKILLEYCIPLLINKNMEETFTKSSTVAKKLLNTIISQKKDLEALNERICQRNEVLSKNGKHAIIFFNEIYNEFRVLKSMEIPDEIKQKRLKKAWKVLGQLDKKIKQLEQKEVNFEAEEDSYFVQEGRYKERAAKIYAYICKLTNSDPQAINMLYSRLDFSKSKYIEVNKTLNKKFKNNSNFPDFSEVLKCIKKCCTKHYAHLSESEVSDEARLCFTELVRLMKQRRQRDLEITMCQFISNADPDPAETDTELDEKLKDSKNNLESEVDKVCEKFTRLQEAGNNPDVSEDSSDSNFQESDDNGSD